MFKDKLLKLRKAAKLSRERASDLIGVTSQTIYNWETGKAEPPPMFQRAIIDALNKLIDLESQIKGDQ